MALTAQPGKAHSISHVSLSLCKYSHVTTPRMYGKLVWTHVVGRGSLLAVFDETTSADSQGSVATRNRLRVFEEDRVIVRPNSLQMTASAVSYIDSN